MALDRSSFSCEMIAQSFKFLFWQTSSMLVGQCLGDLYQKKILLQSKTSYDCNRKQIIIPIGKIFCRKEGGKEVGREGGKEGRKQASNQSRKEGRKE